MKGTNVSNEKERLRKAVFGKLRTLRRKLNQQGIPCDYSRSVLSHDAGMFGFRIACDGSTVLPHLSVRVGTDVETFEGANFETGLTRLRELFGAEQQESELQAEAAGIS